MGNKAVQYRIQGMNRDFSESTSNVDKAESLFKYAYELKNMRVITNSTDNTTFSLENEKGTYPIELDITTEGNLLGMIIIGVITFNDKIVLFLTSENANPEDPSSLIYKDKIICINRNFTGNLIYEGNLGFDKLHPIEAVSCYENEEIQKVYWTDGINSPRMVNIASTNIVYYGFTTDSRFDFAPTMLLNEEVTITQNSSGGYFPAGTIQYVLTYSNKYAQETNPFYISPLYYHHKNSTNSSEKDRAGKVDELCPNSYTIHIESVDRTFELINIYAISTTQQNTRSVKKVVTISTTSIVDYTDNGLNGETFDLNTAAFLNEKWTIVCQTLNHKDNRLFLGNLESVNPKIQETLKVQIKTHMKNNLTYDWSDSRKITLPVTDTDYYPYNTQLDLNSFEMKTFKSKETYRFGVQLQDKTGKWSEVIYIDDRQNPYYPHYTCNLQVGNTYVDYYLTYVTSELTQNIVEEAVNEGFVNIRPVIVYPSWAERETVCQGLLCPTVYSTAGRLNGLPYAQSSWFTRPNAPEQMLKPSYNSYSSVLPYTKYADMDTGFISEFRHNVPIPSNNCRNGEFYCNDAFNNLVTPYGNDSTGYWRRDLTGSNFYIDQSLVTLHSPELEFDSETQAFDLSSLKLRIIGVINWTSNKADIQIQAGASPNNPIGYQKDTLGNTYSKPSGSTVSSGFIKPLNPIGTSGIHPNGYKTLISGPFWNDYAYYPGTVPFDTSKNIISHVVFPFHKDELNNYDYSDPKAVNNLEYFEYHRVPISSKILYNARYSIGNNYYNEGILNFGEGCAFTLGDIKVWNGNELVLNPPAGSDIDRNIIYYGGRNVIINAPTRHEKSFTITTNSHSYTLKVIDHIGGAVVEGINSINDNLYYEYRVGDNTRYNYSGVEYIGNNGSHNKSLWSKYGNHVYTNQYDYAEPYCFIPDYCAADQAWVRMNYSSTPHAVVVLNNYGSSQLILPTIHSLNRPNTSESGTWHYGSGDAFYGRGTEEHYDWNKPFWSDALAGGSTAGTTFLQVDLEDWKCALIRGYNGEVPSYDNVECGWSLIGELYRTIDDDSRFGGNSESAIASNIWYIAGETKRLDTTLPYVELKWTEGDTYFQRYDHLKTYSPQNVQNGIVDVASFMVETRINLDGRCDINRGRNYFTANNTNFNQMNMAYTQDNNMYTGHTLDETWLNLDKYPNQIAWSPIKNYGEQIDSWCNISMATTLDFDGNKGVIRKIERFANELFVFQDNAISLIQYNRNVQIATSVGTPIQLANSNAIDGKVYITTNIGTRNKWSIVNTPSGIYFIDYANTGIFKFNGQNVPSNLTDTFGFRSFMFEELNQNLDWNSYNFGTNETGNSGEFVGYYDSINGDVFYINKNKCLAYNDKLNAFTSFYSYENTPFFTNFEDKGIFITNNSPLNKKLWQEHAGDYCTFFGLRNDYSVTLITNPNSYTDKIFNNIEYRADVFNNDGTYMADKTFRDIRVWNEYQDSGAVSLDTMGRLLGEDYSSIHIPSNTKKKFRMWRVNIPRNANSRDRIRNPWTYIKLSGGTKKGDMHIYKHILNDIIVYYFE